MHLRLLQFRSVVNKRAFSTKKTPIRLTIFGPPGGGKGTQSAKLTRDFGGVPVISTGDLLRQAIKDQTPLGKKVEATIQSGVLVDDSTMLEVVRGALAGHDEFIMDGYPRTLQQAQNFDKLLSELRKPLALAMFIEVGNDVILERLSNRRVHQPSGRIYHLSYNPPKTPGIDDVTGEPLIQRDDDKEETILNRLKQYDESTTPLFSYYKSTGILRVIPSPNSDVGYVTMHQVMNETFPRS